MITEEEKRPLFLLSLPPKGKKRGKKGEKRGRKGHGTHKRDIYTRVAIGVFDHAWIRICLNLAGDAAYI